MRRGTEVQLCAEHSAGREPGPAGVLFLWVGAVQLRCFVVCFPCEMQERGVS